MEKTEEEKAWTIKMDDPSSHYATANIFAAFDSGKLKRGQVLRLVFPQDPKWLHGQFQVTRPGKFQWSLVEQGPPKWVVHIKKIK